MQPWIAEQTGVPLFLAMMLEARGFRTPEAVKAMLQSDEALPDPFLLPDMDKAAARLRRAIDNFERIAIYGDYDADGVTATALLFSYLQTCGANAMYYIPDREKEGYGMNLAAVEQLAENGVKLIVTVDNGIASHQEIARAKELGMDVVVTDHHRPQETLPEPWLWWTPGVRMFPAPAGIFRGSGWRSSWWPPWKWKTGIPGACWKIMRIWRPSAPSGM